MAQPATATDDYPSSCEEAPFVNNEALGGVLETPDDYDTVRVEVAEGDRVNLRVLVPTDEDRFGVDIGGSAEYSISETHNARPNAGNSGVNGFAGNVVGTATVFAESDGNLCLGVDDLDGETADIPYSWNLSVGVNAEAPALIESGLAETPSGPVDPDGDYADVCENSRVFTGGVFQGSLDTPDDHDTLRVLVEEGDRVNFRALAAERESRFAVHFGGSAEYSITDTEDSRINAGNSGVNGFEGGTVGTATVFAESDGSLCLSMSDISPETADIPYSWNLSVGVNSDATALVESTPTATPTQTATATPTATDTSTPTVVSTTEPEDSDEDGATNTEDDMSEDSDGQERNDQRRTTSGSGPGFGEGVAVAALFVGALVAAHRD